MRGSRFIRNNCRHISFFFIIGSGDNFLPYGDSTLELFFSCGTIVDIPKAILKECFCLSGCILIVFIVELTPRVWWLSFRKKMSLSMYLIVAWTKYFKQHWKHSSHRFSSFGLGILLNSQLLKTLSSVCLCELFLLLFIA